MTSPPAARLARRETLDGWIASCGFASGDRFVAGIWRASPIGPMFDVMWAAPDGTRTLLANRERVAEYVTSVYAFDAVVVADGSASVRGGVVDIALGPLRTRLGGGRAWPLPLGPSAALTRAAGPIARLAMGVTTYGRSPTGVREWYRARSVRWVRTAEAQLDGTDLGAMHDVRPALNVGFSEPPRRPSIVSVRPLLARD